MTWFCCIGTESKLPDIGEIFDQFELTDVSKTPIGRCVTVNREDRRAYMVTLGGDSTDVLGLGYRRASRFDQFVKSLERLSLIGPATSLLCHSFRGDVETESVTASRKETVEARSLSELGRFEEDVRYVILP